MQLVKGTAFEDYMEFYDLKKAIDEALADNRVPGLLTMETVDRLTLAACLRNQPVVPSVQEGEGDCTGMFLLWASQVIKW